jgi:AAA domain, putative AbiEii toxin, Type IV TA system
LITSAEVSHFKSIQDASLRFRPINIIVGPNGSGKSNILDALYFIHDCAVDDIDTAVTKRHGIDSLRQWSRTRPYNIVIDLKFSNEAGKGGYKVTISSNKGQYRIIEEFGTWTGPNPRDRHNQDPDSVNYVSTFRRDELGRLEFSSTLPDLPVDRSFDVEIDDLFLTFIAGRGLFGSLVPFRPIVEEVVSFSKYNIYPNTLRQPQLVSRATSLVEDGSNLSSVLKKK